MAKHNQVQFFHEAVERQLGFAAMVQSGKTLYLSGLISVDEKLSVVGPGDMAAQITQIYNVMEKVLAMSQATLENVVNEFMFTSNMQALIQASGVRVARYARCAPPANTAVQVAGLFLPDAMLEIQATAILD
jgi:enamine deaminase RidA (YjgF/YER057c/UK114 family)